MSKGTPLVAGAIRLPAWQDNAFNQVCQTYASNIDVCLVLPGGTSHAGMVRGQATAVVRDQ